MENSSPIEHVVNEQSSTKLIRELGLRQHIRRADALSYLLCALVSVDSIGIIVKSGLQSLLWLIILAFTFLFPYSSLTTAMAESFPYEGGPYLWIRLAFSRLAGSICSVFYWISNPVWLGGILAVTAVTAVDKSIAALNNTGRCFLGVSFVWLTVLLAIVSVRYSRFLLLLGAIARVLILTSVTLFTLLYASLAKSHPITHGFHPTIGALAMCAPVIIFNYVGLEVPSSSASEIVNPVHDVRFAIRRGALAVVIMYLIPIATIAFLLPAREFSTVGGFLDVFTLTQSTFKSQADNVLFSLCSFGTTIAFLVATISTGASWTMAGDRVLAIAAYDGAGPRLLGSFSRKYGTPVVTNLLSGIIASIVALVTLHGSSNQIGGYFQAVLNLSVSTGVISYLLMLPAYFRLAQKLPSVKHGSLGSNKWKVCLYTSLSIFWIVFAVTSTVWPGFTLYWGNPLVNPDSALPAPFSGHRLLYELTQIIPLSLISLLGLAFYVIGKRENSDISPD